ncbi:hypothetical protein N9K75_02585 [bacterium]|nr:hypothetical protein [bacterium]
MNKKRVDEMTRKRLDRKEKCPTCTGIKNMGARVCKGCHLINLTKQKARTAARKAASKKKKGAPVKVKLVEREYPNDTERCWAFAMKGKRYDV